MSPFFTYLLSFFLGVFFLIIIIELAINKGIKNFLIQIIILMAVIIFFHVTTGFPKPVYGFGGISPLINIGIMFICTILGIGAHYIFYLEEEFKLVNFLKPLVISPIILLPLLGSVKGGSQLEPMQVVSFGFLAFQNGFFWKEVLKRARAKI
jgi:hypothetical protein